jgi:hypothetical protein
MGVTISIIIIVIIVDKQASLNLWFTLQQKYVLFLSQKIINELILKKKSAVCKHLLWIANSASSGGAVNKMILTSQHHFIHQVPSSSLSFSLPSPQYLHQSIYHLYTINHAAQGW